MYVMDNVGEIPQKRKLIRIKVKTIPIDIINNGETSDDV